MPRRPAPAPIEPPSDPALALAETRAWVERAVISLNLCPFARAVQVKGQVRYALSEARDTDALLGHLIDEMQHLQATDPAQTDTTLLVHPHVLQDFDDYNQFLDVADAALVSLRLEGVLQVASFHPHYRFAGTRIDDVTNATNRSPHPTLHLLREGSIDRAVAAFPQAEAIFERNLQTLERLGLEGWNRLRAQCAEDAHGTPSPPASPEDAR